MPKFLEKKLKNNYGTKSSIPYKIMNKMGMMNKVGTTTRSKIKAGGMPNRPKMKPKMMARKRRAKISKAADRAFGI